MTPPPDATNLEILAYPLPVGGGPLLGQSLGYDSYPFDPQDPNEYLSPQIDLDLVAPVGDVQSYLLELRASGGLTIQTQE